MSNNIDSSALLSQLRTMAVQAGVQNVGNTTAGKVAATKVAGLNETEPFGKLLQSSIEHVNQRQTHSANLVKAFETGKPGVELSEVMIEAEKARITFEALSQVRKKLVKAYQEVMSMPV